MRHFALFCCVAVLIACARSEDQPAGDTTAAPPATPDAPAGISLADVAGTWRMRSTDEAGGTPVEFELTATADPSGWTLTFPNREPVPLRVVAVDGDSIVTEARHESVLREGIQVSTRTVNRLQDGKLVGITEARYALSSGDSVARRRIEGTRAP